MELPENTSINKYKIELMESKQSSYKAIYTLSLVELKTLKTCLKTSLKTRFIKSFKSPTGASILFNKKPDSSFYLCIKYQGFNNLTIKN